MNRRDILKTTGLVFAGSTLLPIETFALSKNDSEEKDRQAKLSQKRKLINKVMENQDKPLPPHASPTKQRWTKNGASVPDWPNENGAL